MKNRFMKRGLSLLLAVAMMFGMIQAPLFMQEAQAATLDASDASYDYDVSKIKCAAGSVETGAGANEGSILNAFDNNESTIWHSLWSPGAANQNLWVVMALEEKTEVDAVRWQSRGANGDVTSYEIFGTTDNVNINEDDGNDKNNTIVNDTEINWELIMTGTWSSGNGWKIAEFDSQELTAIKVVVLTSTADNGNTNYYASAKEIRVRTTELADPIPVDPIPVSEKPDNGTTQKQPFARGTAGSDKFRIPALITTKDGTLVAAIDARWNTYRDARGIDTIVSTSTDDGANWNYTFANYLGDYGNESADEAAEKKYAATFIDPELIYDPNAGDKGTVYMLVDLYAGGYAINSAIEAPVSGDPFTDAGYLKLKASGASTYDYYLKEGKIYGTDGTEVSGYTVDGHFNLFYNDAEAGNLFFNSDDQAKKPAYQVLPTTYLYLTKSTDNGATWSAPQLLDVKADDEYFYGVGPGRGIVTSDGVLMFSCYKYDGSDAQRSSVIYSTDNGATWKRTGNVTSSIWSSESQLVELADGTIRMFFRNGQSCICYVDATKGTDAEGNRTYTWGDYKTTSISNHSNCQISAMMYSKKIDGKDAILVACPSNTSSRSGGKIFAGLVNSDNSMEWKYSYAGFGTGYFQYSCMTELTDGSIGILYEDCSTTDGSAVYKKIAITDIVDDASIGGFWVEDVTGNVVTDVTMKPSDTATYSIFGETAGSLSVLSSNTDVATVALNETATAAADDTAVATFTVTANADLVGYGTSTITVIDGSESTSFNVKVVSGDTDNYERVELKVDETATFQDKTGYYVGQETGVDSSKATVELTGVENPQVVVGQLATERVNNFNGAYVDIDDCLYTFTSTGTDNVYTISATTANGTTVYLNLDANVQLPNKQNASKEITLYAGSTDGTVVLYDKSAGDSGSSLHFHKTDDNHHFNRCSDNGGSKAGDVEHQFEIYKQSSSVENSNIKGYEQVKSLSDITEGKYLIVAEDDGVRYILYPYAGSPNDNYNHVAKVTEGYYEEIVAQEGSAGSTSTETVSFAGGLRSLSDLEYTFEENDDGTYYVSAINEDGEKVYLSLRNSAGIGGQKPHQAATDETISKIEFTQGTVNAERFRIKDTLGYVTATGLYTGSYLHFWSNSGTRHHFDRCANVCGNAADHEYELYVKSDSAPTDSPIKGYAKLTSIDQIQDDESYLIAFNENGTIYLLNPPADVADAKFAHVAILTEDYLETTSGTTDITITGVAPGETTAVIGDTTYYITVTEDNTVGIKLEVGRETLIDGIVTKQPDPADVVEVTSKKNAKAPYTLASSIEEGAYLISTQQKTHILKNTMSSNNSWSWLGFQMQSVSVTDDVINTEYADYVFDLKNVNGVDNGYTIQNSNGEYLNFALGENGEYNDGWGYRAVVKWSDSPQTILIEALASGGYKIYTELNGRNYGLNNYGNNNSLTSGYSNFNAGWYFFKATEESTNTLVITGQSVGTTKMVIDNTTYNITVVDYVDYTALDEQIAIAEAILADTDNGYTEDSLNNLQTVLNKAKESKITTDISSAEKFKEATEAAATMTATLKAAIDALKDPVKSYSLAVGEVAPVIVSGELSGYDEAEKAIAKIEVADGNMTIEGLSGGYVQIEVGVVTYNIVVAPKAEGFPIVAESGSGYTDLDEGEALKVVTKLTISDNNTFDLGVSEGTNVIWTSRDANILTVDANGVITCKDVTTTVITTVTATVDGVDYTIPVIVHPGPTNGNKLVNIYIDEISNLNVYYSWNCSTDLVHACIGEAIYYSTNVDDPIAIDFMSAPKDGYALTYMAATHGQGHYMTVHTGDDATLDESAKGFLNYVGSDGAAGAGVTQKALFTEAQVKAMLYAGIVRHCDGAMGFTRKSDATGQIASSLTFQAEKLPTIEKSVHGILPADARRPGYRTYEDGMNATEGEFVYFQVTVKAYKPLSFKPDTYQSLINYTNAVITDDVLAGASFITDKGQETILAPDQIIPSPVITTEDITNALNALDWSEGQLTQELNYYVAYKITADDIGSTLTNTAKLSYDYQAEYSTGGYSAAANAEAQLTVADYIEKEFVVDFGLPVSITLPTWGKVLGENGDAAVQADYDVIRLKTGSGDDVATATYGTVTVDEVFNTAGDTTTGWKVTYTPTETLKAADVITVYAANVKDEAGNPAAYTIKVYPASSVYYEEKFMDTSKDTDGDTTNSEWTIAGTAITAEQESAQPGYTTALENWTANYGYDAVYAEPSNSEAVTAKTTDGKEKAAFKFTGTGVDVFANCDADTGIVMVMVKQLGADGTSTLKKMFTVDTKLNFGTIDNANAATLGSQTLNVPIVSISEHGLDYGDYEVLLVHAPKKVKTQTTVDGVVTETTTAVETDLRIDGFRVYGTLQDPDATIVHGKDHEAAPVYLDMKDSILAGMSISDAWDENAGENKTAYAEQLAGNLLSQIYASSGAKLAGAVVTAADSTTLAYSGADLKDFLDNTSKNELYLYPGQSLVFALDFATLNPQLALKALNGAGEYKITKAETGNASATPETVTKELKANTEMYYLLGMLKNADKTQLATTFTISNTGTSVISVTKLKVITGAAVETFVELSAEDLVPAFSVVKNGDAGEKENVVRIAGEDRYETAYLVAEEYKEVLGVEKFDAVIVATGKNFADALSGSYLASVKNAPILLTNGKEDNVAKLHAYIKDNVAEGGVVYILGGTVAVPESVEAIEGYDPVRLAGETRYETNLAILDEAGLDNSELLIATGRTFADSLSASALKKPIMLVKDEVTENQEAVLAQYIGGRICIIGGTGAVSEDIENALAQYGTVRRVYGQTRYETSIAVADEFFRQTGMAVIANAQVFPDGLCGGPLAGALNAPLILTADGKTVDAAAYMQDKSLQNGIVLGGDARISDDSVGTIFGISE